MGGGDPTLAERAALRAAAAAAAAAAAEEPSAVSPDELDLAAALVRVGVVAVAVAPAVAKVSLLGRWRRGWLHGATHSALTAPV